MRYFTNINNQKCLEWGLNANQGALLDYLISEHERLKDHLFDKYGVCVFEIDFTVICQQLPLYYKKPYTVYRALKVLIAKKFIIRHRVDVKNQIKIVSVSLKGLEWNDEQVTNQ
ncbi:hypothetical protein [Lonepinella koalarum]|uniref:hypothetical protein n=1 Tax=Lonepinella koalarum TaxID=53417 RepID=UPI003F6E3A0B